ncbi:MerC domain-containing protein [Aliikangiella marina]|uniref:MerC domain-containing protein n=1 Tax=Aliikangiella marina TaxID=1712262 RepID=A0A545T1J8_9GAMM|nr:MerC domain-containing protein [Aliikangiella marina]TQV71084.1 MerC domain-containing protein [Aliikangiella marina]
MKSFQSLSDKSAIGLSLLCLLHCLGIPLLLVIAPSIAILQLNDELFHLWMVLAVLPISIYAVTSGCKKHKKFYLMGVVGCGLLFLVLALSVGALFLGKTGEVILTTIGSLVIAYGHFKNFRYSQRVSN